jgi:polyisoprenyl-teichoic acid--peptidoglycan teichoic acid transferase
MVVHVPGVGHYDIEGMNWTGPPIVQKPDARRRIGSRTYSLHFDGSKLRLVAFRAGDAIYWVSNTLTRSLSNKQMLGIAASMRPLGRG